MDKSYDIAIVGCGWLGMPLAKSLQDQSLRIVGTTTQSDRLHEIQSTGCDAAVWDVKPGRGTSTPWRKLDTLVLTLPPRSAWGQSGCERVHHSLAEIAESTGVAHLVLCSSTSVYPQEDGTYFEADASDVVSRHTSIRGLPLEQVHSGRSYVLSVVRFGGLFGAGRDPAAFARRRGTISRSETPVNLIHKSDAIAVLRFVLTRRQGDVWNAVAPEHPTRRALYAKAGLELTGDGVATPRRIVSCAALEEAGFDFSYRNPLDALPVGTG